MLTSTCGKGPTSVGRFHILSLDSPFGSRAERIIHRARHESSGCRCAAAWRATHSSNVCTPRSGPGPREQRAVAHRPAVRTGKRHLDDAPAASRSRSPSDAPCPPSARPEARRGRAPGRPAPPRRAPPAVRPPRAPRPAATASPARPRPGPASSARTAARRTRGTAWPAGSSTAPVRPRRAAPAAPCPRSSRTARRRCRRWRGRRGARRPAAVSAASRVRVTEPKNARDAASDIVCVEDTSITTSTPVSASASPAPVTRSTPVDRVSTTGSWPVSRTTSTT